MLLNSQIVFKTYSSYYRIYIMTYNPIQQMLNMKMDLKIWPKMKSKNKSYDLFIVFKLQIIYNVLDKIKLATVKEINRL